MSTSPSSDLTVTLVTSAACKLSCLLATVLRGKSLEFLSWLRDSFNCTREMNALAVYFCFALLLLAMHPVLRMIGLHSEMYPFSSMLSSSHSHWIPFTSGCCWCFSKSVHCASLRVQSDQKKRGYSMKESQWKMLAKPQKEWERESESRE